MRLLVHVTTPAMLRHFTSVLRSLANGGHTVRIASPAGTSEVPPPAELVGHKRISFVSCPQYRSDAWGRRVYELRALRDYLRYTEGPLSEAPKLRRRALSKLLKAVTDGARSSPLVECPRCHQDLSADEAARALLGSHERVGPGLGSLLALTEATIPSDRGIEAFLRRERPDVLMVTPLIKIGSYQADYVKSAKAIGLPVVFPVFSWDNLSTKGLIHVRPDRVLVWNEWQRKEAIEMHGVPADRIVVTGAARFDAFFALKPRRSRVRLCRKLRLDPGQPIVTYLCSSSFVAKHEQEFVLRWIDEVRRVPGLEKANIIIRPHPRHTAPWRALRAQRLPGLAIAFPRSITVDQTLFDTVHHSIAVVALNTSAELEAGIVGRPVLTILAPEFSGGQQGVVHFHYLLRDRGGFVEVAPDFETHRRHLAAAMAGEYDPAAIRTFIGKFLRPSGLDRPATPIMREAILALDSRDRGRAARVAAGVWNRVRAGVDRFQRQPPAVLRG